MVHAHKPSTHSSRIQYPQSTLHSVACLWWQHTTPALLYRVKQRRELWNPRGFFVPQFVPGNATKKWMCLRCTRAINMLMQGDRHNFEDQAVNVSNYSSACSQSDQGDQCLHFFMTFCRTNLKSTIGLSPARGPSLPRRRWCRVDRPCHTPIDESGLLPRR